MAEPAELLAAVEARLRPVASAGRGPGVRVLVTAGGTREPIDSVRFIGNRSSGRMGFALAAAGRAPRGARSRVVPPTSRSRRRPGVEVVPVRDRRGAAAPPASARFDACDVLLMAAAVADFRPRQPGRPTSSRRTRGAADDRARADRGRAQRAGRTPAARPGAGRLRRRARRPARSPTARAKLERKRLDAIVVNDVSQPGIGFDAPDNEVTMITAGGARAPVAAGRGRTTIADGVLDEVQQLRAQGEESDGAVRADPDSRRRSLRRSPPSRRRAAGEHRPRPSRSGRRR